MQNNLAFRNYCFLLFSILLLAACNKDDEHFVMSYPATYVLDKMYNTTPVRMYTISGEVKDAALINAFVRKNVTGDFYYLQNKTTSINSGEKITFLAANDALITTGSDSTRYDAERMGDDWVLTGKKELQLNHGQVDHNYINYVNFIRAISKYKPLVYDEMHIPQTNGVAYVHKTKKQFIVTLNKQEAHFHRMTFTLKRGYSTNTQTTFNRFDATGLSQLRNTDTLLVQEFVGAAVKQ